jgi:hypothetical protein
MRGGLYRLWLNVKKTGIAALLKDLFDKEAAETETAQPFHRERK